MKNDWKFDEDMTTKKSKKRKLKPPVALCK